MRFKTCTWQELSDYCEQLLTLKKGEEPTSAILIGLNRLYHLVELYLRDKGLVLNADGQWNNDHPTYPLFYQLAECIESCKEMGGRLDDHFTCFVQERLLPELYRQWEQPGCDTRQDA
jgi:hypothetical protein